MVKTAGLKPQNAQHTVQAGAFSNTTLFQSFLTGRVTQPKFTEKASSLVAYGHLSITCS